MIKLILVNFLLAFVSVCECVCHSYPNAFHSIRQCVPGFFFPWILFLSCTLTLLLLSVPYYLSTAISCNITESQRINYIITISRWAQFCWLAVFATFYFISFYFIFHGIPKKLFFCSWLKYAYVRMPHSSNNKWWILIFFSPNNSSTVSYASR